MELLINIVIWLFVLMCAAALFLAILPTLAKEYHSNRSSRTREKLPQLLRSFDAANSGNELGGGFVLLTRSGFFQNLRTDNHGNNFPERKQRQNFNKHSTPEIAQSMKEVGESFERFSV